MRTQSAHRNNPNRGRSVLMRWIVAATAGAGVGVAAAAATAGMGMAAWGAFRLLRKREEDLRGQVALITGGSRGLGLQLARDLGALGCRVAICARDADELERARQDLASRGVDVHASVCDVAKREQVAKFVDKALARFGKLDIVVANAGII